MDQSNSHETAMNTIHWLGTQWIMGTIPCTHAIGDFRVAFRLCFKASPRPRPHGCVSIWKRKHFVHTKTINDVTFSMKMQNVLFLIGSQLNFYAHAFYTRFHRFRVDRADLIENASVRTPFIWKLVLFTCKWATFAEHLQVNNIISIWKVFAVGLALKQRRNAIKNRLIFRAVEFQFHNFTCRTTFLSVCYFFRNGESNFWKWKEIDRSEWLVSWNAWLDRHANTSQRRPRHKYHIKSPKYLSGISRKKF